MTPNQRDGWRVVLTVVTIALGAWAVLALALLFAGCDIPLEDGCHSDADCPAGVPAGYDGDVPHGGYHYRCDGYRCINVDECAPPPKPPQGPVFIPPGYFTPPLPESETAVPETSTKEFPFKIPIIVTQGATIDASGKILLPHDNNPPKASNINFVAEQLVALYSYGQTDAASRYVTGNGPGATYTPDTSPIVIDGTGFGGVVGAPLSAHASQATGIRIDSRLDAREGLDIRESIRVLGGDPPVEMDVGSNNTFYAVNFPKAWGVYYVQNDVDTDAVRSRTGVNVASMATTDTTVQITFARPMEQPFYCVNVQLDFNITGAAFGEIFQYDVTDKTVNGFKVELYRLNLSSGAGSTAGVSWNAGKGFSFSVMARQ